MAQYDLTDFEWSVIEPILAQKSRNTPRVDRQVVNGIFRVLCSGASWANLPERYGSPKTCYNRFRRWAKSGVWKQIVDAIAEAYADVQIVVGRSMPVHAPATDLKKATWIDVLGEPPGVGMLGGLSSRRKKPLS
jgi:transposase